MLSYSEYENILRKGKKIDWYDIQVPEELLTKTVNNISEQMVEQINKLESSVDSKASNSYILNLWGNIRRLPYTVNGDFYLIKKKEIEEKISKEVKPNIVEECIKEDLSIKKTKNSQLIFGNKNK